MKLCGMMHLARVIVSMHVQECLVTPCLCCAYCSPWRCSVKTTRQSACTGRPSMTIVCRLGSNTAGVTAKFARIIASSRAAARASGDMLSVPAIGSAASLVPLVYAPAAAVQRCAAGALGGGSSRACSCLCASATSHAAGGCSGGAGERLRALRGGVFAIQHVFGTRALDGWNMHATMSSVMRVLLKQQASSDVKNTRALYDDRTISLTRSAVS